MRQIPEVARFPMYELLTYLIKVVRMIGSDGRLSDTGISMEELQWRSPVQGWKDMNLNPFDHAAVVAHYLAGNRVELTAVDGTPPPDPEDGDAEFYRVRAVTAVAR